MGYKKPPAPQPPVGLTAALPNDWVHAWRVVRVQPQFDVPAWDGSGKVRVTPSVKHVGSGELRSGDVTSGDPPA